MAVCLLLAACSTSRVDERMSYWRAEVAGHLPVGTAKPQAEAFFAARGAKLECCVRSSGPWLHFARERNVGRLLWTEYDVVVEVEFSADEKVASVSVRRWGVGL